MDKIEAGYLSPHHNCLSWKKIYINIIQKFVFFMGVKSRKKWFFSRQQEYTLIATNHKFGMFYT